MSRWQQTIDAYEVSLHHLRLERDTLRDDLERAEAQLADARDRIAQVSMVLSALSLTVANGAPIPGIPRHDDAEILRQLLATYETRRAVNGSEPAPSAKRVKS